MSMSYNVSGYGEETIVSDAKLPPRWRDLISSIGGADTLGEVKVSVALKG